MRKIDDSGKDASRDPVQLLRAFQIVAERLFDDDAGVVPAAGLHQLFDHRLKQRRRNRKVVRRRLCAFHRLVHGLKRRVVRVVAIYIFQQPAQLLPRLGIQAAVLFQRVLRPRVELVQVPPGLGHADHRHIERAALHHRLQRGKDLLVGQVAGRAKKHECVRVLLFHHEVPPKSSPPPALATAPTATRSAPASARSPTLR